MDKGIMHEIYEMFAILIKDVINDPSICLLAWISL